MGNSRLLWSVLLIAFIMALFPYADRWEVEQASREVQIIWDDHGLFRLAQKTEQPVEKILQALDYGDPALAVSPWTPRKMMERGHIFLWPVLFPDRPAPIPRDFARGYLEGFTGYYLYLPDEEKKDFLFSRLPDKMQPAPLAGTDFYSVPPGDKDLRFPEYPLGFNQADLEAIKGTNLPIVARPSVHQEGPLSEPQEILNSLPRLEGLLFEGSEVWGYPDELQKTAALLEGRDIYLGFVEPFLARQKGMRDLGLLEEDRVLRLHSAQQGEMDRQSLERIVARYLRSIRERNARLLYLRPILAGDPGDLLDQNQLLLNNLLEGLQEAGFTIGKDGYFKPLHLPGWMAVVIWTGLMAGGVLLLNLILPRVAKLTPILFILGWLLGWGVFIPQFKFLFLQGILLGGALVAPLLPLIWVLEKRKGPFWLDWLLIGGGTLLGTFIIGGLGAERTLILGLEVFRGVKVALFLPLLVLAYYLYRDQLAGKWKNVRPSLAVFVSMAFLAVALFFYINRSGNFPLIPVPQWEIAFRDFLEQVFIVRPRFKEFLWGHPLLLLGLFLYRQKKWPWVASLALLLGSMGPITMVNSFTHFHTPLWVSLWRSILGLLIGGGLGLLLILFIRWLQKQGRRAEG